MRRYKNMKQKNLMVLDENDDEAVDLFTKLGMPKNFAKTLLYISQVNECRSSEIEKGVNLRQPEVSIVMQELRQRGWVKKQDIKSEGKGRPVHEYKASKSLSEIAKAFEKEKLKEAQDIKNNISELKTLISNR